MNRTCIALVAMSLAMGAIACGGAPDAALPAGGASAVRSTALSDPFNAYDSSTWEMANWANGNPFNCGFLPDHVTFGNGAMTLKLDNTASSGKSYSGGEYRTKDTFSYGRFETRMKAAKASGIVSSFFTYTGSPWDEIDVEILGKNTSQVQFNYYVNGTGGHERVVDLGFDASADFHTYAIDWQPNSISWYVDGVLKHSVTGSTSTLPSHPMQIMMNLWNGIGVDSWLGSFGYSGPLYASYDSASYTPPGSSGYALGVTRSGSGSGTVTSSTGGINCGSTCSVTFNAGTTVTLTATPASGSTFGGWSGACSGTGSCVVTMTAAQSVGAAFVAQQQQGGPISINAGGAAAGGFVADVDFSGGSTYSSTATIDTSLLAGTVPPAAVFQSERYGEFTYTIPGLTAGSSYAVTLYFAETYWTSAGQRTFNVALNGATVLTAFDIYAAAGGARKAVARTFDTTASGSGQIVVAFTRGGGPDNPKVSGIAVAASSPGDRYTLDVTRGGTGSGTIAGGPIACGTTCSGTVASGTTVTLNATPASGSTFTGWSGACVGTGACVVSMTAARSVTATFDLSSGPGPGNCTTATGGQSGNFNTTGAICYTVTATIHGWGCSNADGRTVTVNGAAVTCGQTLSGGSPYTFSFTAGTYPWASFYWW